MPRSPLYLFLLAAILFGGPTYAQRVSKKKKPQKPKTADSISIYLKKKLVYKFTKEEYLHFRDSINFKTNDALHKVNDHKIEWKPSKRPFKSVNVPAAEQPEEDREPVNIYNGDRLVRSLPPSAYRKFKDSIATKTKDTLYAISDMRVEIHPYKALSKTNRSASQNIFVNPQGYVTIIVPTAKTQRHSIVFFADGIEIFQIRSVTETELTLDKTNFIHAGWFSYELYQEEKLIEKGKFFLPK